MDELIIPFPLAHALVEYLKLRPYAEVAGFIQQITTLRPVPPPPPPPVAKAPKPEGQVPKPEPQP